MLKTKKKTKGTPKTKSVKKLKEQVWHIFSKYVRLRDCFRTTGTLKHGKCISCGDLRPINQSMKSFGRIKKSLKRLKRNQRSM